MFLVGFSLLLTVYVLIMPSGAPEWTVWISIFVTFGFGIGVGWIAAENIRFGILVIGVILGSFLGIVVFNLLVYRISTENPLMGLWLTIMFFSVPVALISFTKHEIVIIVFSAFAGSYMLFRGLSVFLGGFPNEFKVYECYINDKMNELP